MVGSNPGPQWHIEGAGDFNSNGKADILWQHDNGQAAVWFMDGFLVQETTLVGVSTGPDWQLAWS